MPRIASLPFRFMLNTLTRRCGVAPVIASSGRAGSTMLNDAAAAAVLQNGWLAEQPKARIWTMETAWDMQQTQYRPGIVYKTHDYPPPHGLPAIARVIYTVADPVDVVFSVITQGKIRGRSWVDEHCAHLRVPASDASRMLDADVLQLGAHFDAWMQPQEFPVVLVKYEAIWDHADLINDFLGVKLVLPPYKPRKANLNDFSAEEISRVLHTYADLRQRVDSMPPFQRLAARHEQQA